VLTRDRVRYPYALPQHPLSHPLTRIIFVPIRVFLGLEWCPHLAFAPLRTVPYFFEWVEAGCGVAMAELRMAPWLVDDGGGH